MDEDGEQGSGSFVDFDGYDGETATDVTADHDEWGVTACQ